jgi:hypothetical protein
MNHGQTVEISPRHALRIGVVPVDPPCIAITEMVRNGRSPTWHPEKRSVVVPTEYARQVIAALGAVAAELEARADVDP